MLQNYIEYIKSGISVKSAKKNYVQIIFGTSLLWPLCFGLILGVLFGGSCWYAFIAMMAIGLALFLTGMVLLIKPLNTRNKLILAIIMYLSLTMHNSILMSMLFIVRWGFRVQLTVMLLLPAILTGILYIVMILRLKGNKPFKKSKMHTVTFTAGGLIGYSIARVIADTLSQDAAFIICCVCMLLLNLIISLGSLNIQRLYYLTKLEKQGLVTEESFVFDEEQSNAK